MILIVFWPGKFSKIAFVNLVGVSKHAVIKTDKTLLIPSSDGAGVRAAGLFLL
jgi:hypothetical protein